MHAQIAGITPKLRNLAEPGRPRSRPPGQFSRRSLEALFKLVAQLPQAGERDANAGHGRPFALHNLCCSAIWMLRLTNQGTATRQIHRIASRIRLPDVHEFTVPHLAARVPIRRLLKRMSSAQQQRLFHMSADNLKTDRKTFCRLAAR
jgi:hypothetical protein